jgi:Ras-related protein Rab-1A
VHKNTSEGICYLIGNKCDTLESERKISFDQGKQLAESLNIRFWEASALSGTNIEENFQQIVQECIEKRLYLMSKDAPRLLSARATIDDLNQLNRKPKCCLIL